MRKVFLALFILIGIPFSATTYYIDPSGSDSTGNKPSEYPWKSLDKACNSVRTSGSSRNVPLDRLPFFELMENLKN